MVERKEDQHDAIKHLNLDVKQLETTTMDCLSNWFKNPEHPKNAEKRPFLREIFKVAKMQERFKNNELG